MSPMNLRPLTEPQNTHPKCFFMTPSFRHPPTSEVFAYAKEKAVTTVIHLGDGDRFELVPTIAVVRRKGAGLVKHYGACAKSRDVL